MPSSKTRPARTVEPAPLAGPSSVPPLADLVLLHDLAAKLGMSMTTAHRWRCDPETPLVCWKRGQSWASTEAAARQFIAARTAASNQAD